MHKLYFKDDSGIWLRNVSFAELAEQLIVRAGHNARSTAEHQDVNKLSDMYANGELWNGRCFDMAEDLKELKLPEFWSDQLYQLAEDVLDGRVGVGFETGRRLSLIFGSYAWSNFFGLRAREEGRVN